MNNMKETKASNRYAVVDLEATGTGIDAKIIQIGIVMVQDGEIIDTYSTDINPYEPLDEHIKELTGITDQQLSQAPDFGQVASAIYDMIGDAIFVAHNVTFDANLLAEALFFEGYELVTPRVDTVELAQLFFPTFEKYSLGHLAEYLDLGLEQAHTAVSDAIATARLLIKIQEKIASLPKCLVDELVRLADNLLFESRLVIDELYPQLSDMVPPHTELVHGLVLKKREPNRKQRQLSSDFVTNLSHLGLHERKDQTTFARLVEERLVDEQHSVHFIQAQTGLGKTYGYLLPLLARTNEQLLVAVPTKLLQEQIMEQEGRRLQEMFHVSVCSLKAPKHFIKLDAYWKTLYRQDDNRLVNHFKMRLLVWLSETNTGDLDELKQKHRCPSYFDEICHNGKLDKESLFWSVDFWHCLQKTANSSRILITNYAYFLSHLKDQRHLIDHRLIVLDEAQKFLLVAEQLATGSQELPILLQLLQSKKDKAQHLLDQRLYESCQFEVNDLVYRFRHQELRNVDESDLRQLRQNLIELQDSDLRELERLLDYYDHFWLEEKTIQNKRSMYLRATKDDLLDISQYMPNTKIFCISATLTISKHLSLADLLGFKEATFDSLPLRKVTNQCILFPTDLPDIASYSNEDYAHYLVKHLCEMIAFGKPMIVLFTSISLLLQVSDLLEQSGVSHLAQHKHGLEMNLKRRFEKGDCQLLLGTGAFWEGIDFAKQKQVLQVITRLPFDNPKDRFIKKLNQRLRNDGKNPFYDYALPIMMMKLRQAIGRTNRDIQQQSLIVVLDNRIYSRQYGKQILAFFEKDYPVLQIEKEHICNTIQQFFDRK